MKALRIKDVIDKVSLSQSTIYKMVALDQFPKPFQLAPNRVAWLESEVDDWLAKRAAVRVAPAGPSEMGVGMGVGQNA